MKIDEISTLLLKCLQTYQDESGDSLRAISKHAGVTQSFLNHMVEYRASNAGSSFAQKKLAKFFCRKGVLRKSYKEIFMNFT